MDLNAFYNGNEWYAYRYFGAHVINEGVQFRVYAPKACKVMLIGSFANWCEKAMEPTGRGGIYSLFVPDAKAGDMYKYRIYHGDGTVTDKADPYGFAMELRPCSASIIVDENYIWEDWEWMEHREKLYNHPFHIYEIHFGSWKAKGESWFAYEEMAQELIPYLKEMGYTHVELMPITEYPLDASWGYQSTGFFAPTARYGKPAGLKAFINACHKAGIGVLLDVVFVHFAVDDYGLSMFDGSSLYELPFEDAGYSEWGSCIFAHGRGEVASFLKSCANYWLTEFHFDGLRMDAVSNIIYWKGKKQCGVNEQALYFIQSLNDGLHNIHPTAILIAEDSTDYRKVTAPIKYGGLGFDYKWDLGFMHDTLFFFGLSQKDRRKHYDMLLFSMHYFSNELYMLPFSHDEVVHGKKTILDKMYGTYEEKFAQCRTLFLYMLTHPGKKLNFMGNEIGQFREWAEYRPQDFDVLLDYPMHQQFQRFMQDINRIYCHHPALYVEEYNRDCFTYIINDKPEDLVYAYLRTAGDERILTVMNLSDNRYTAYKIPLSGNCKLVELINTAACWYGGECEESQREIMVYNGQCSLCLEPYSGCLFVLC